MNDDDEDWDDVGEELNSFRERFEPYQRYIMIFGTIILILLVVFLGYAYGAAKVCEEMGGMFDGQRIACHPDKPIEEGYNPRRSILPEFNTS